MRNFSFVAVWNDNKPLKAFKNRRLRVAITERRNSFTPLGEAGAYTASTSTNTKFVDLSCIEFCPTGKKKVQNKYKASISPFTAPIFAKLNIVQICNTDFHQYQSRYMEGMGITSTPLRKIRLSLNPFSWSHNCLASFWKEIAHLISWKSDMKNGLVDDNCHRQTNRRTCSLNKAFFFFTS